MQSNYKKEYLEFRKKLISDTKEDHETLEKKQKNTLIGACSFTAVWICLILYLLYLHDIFVIPVIMGCLLAVPGIIITRILTNLSNGNDWLDKFSQEQIIDEMNDWISDQLLYIDKQLNQANTEILRLKNNNVLSSENEILRKKVESLSEQKTVYNQYIDKLEKIYSLAGEVTAVPTEVIEFAHNCVKYGCVHLFIPCAYSENYHEYKTITDKNVKIWNGYFNSNLSDDDKIERIQKSQKACQLPPYDKSTKNYLTRPKHNSESGDKGDVHELKNKRYQGNFYEDKDER